MNIEKKRLKTYAKWPKDAPVTAESCAKFGFYYTGKGLEVECHFCGVKIRNWVQGDNPLDKHISYSPDCKFIRDPFRSGNVPIFRKVKVPKRPPDYLTYQSRLDSFRKWKYADVVTPESLAEAGFYSLQVGDKVKCVYCKGVVLHWEPGDDPKTEHKKLFPKCKFVLADFNYENFDEPRKEKVKASYTGQHLASTSRAGPFHPNYEDPDERMRSFDDWPLYKTQTPADLVDAGFFYSGTGDRVRCFYCNGTLKSWQPEDDVWEQHAKWFPLCRYLLERKGVDFIVLHSGIRRSDLDSDIESIGTPSETS